MANQRCWNGIPELSPDASSAYAGQDADLLDKAEALKEQVDIAMANKEQGEKALANAGLGS